MNIEEIKKRNERRKALMNERENEYSLAREIEYNRLVEGSVDDNAYLLSIIEQKDAELTKATEIIKFQVERNDKQRKNYFEQEAIILQVEKTLKLIANGNNDFPTWEDAVDVLKDVRLVADEALKALRG